MKRCFVLAVLLAIGSLGHAQEAVKDRKAFIPSRKQVEVKGTAIGILLADGQPVLSTEGRSGPADQLVFSADGNSYRWIYVPTQDNPQITNLQVPLPGGQKAVYGALNLANLRSVSLWAITQPYTLVEIEVNGGRGSPAGDSFVGTNYKVLENTKDYPLKVTEVINQLKDLYAKDVAKKQVSIDDAMKDAAKKSLNGKEPTGPREKKELMYVTWLNESSTMRVHFKTTMSDGAYTMVGGGVNPKDPPPLPLPKLKGKGRLVPPGDPVIARVAPPRNVQYKVGTTFGVEFGAAYIVNKKGEVVGTEELPIESFSQQLNAPPFIRPGGRDLPPPPLPLPPAKE
jgi:hypothetical protein